MTDHIAILERMMKEREHTTAKDLLTRSQVEFDAQKKHHHRLPEITHAESKLYNAQSLSEEANQTKLEEMLEMQLNQMKS